jgi:hypothetical protein
LQVSAVGLAVDGWVFLRGRPPAVSLMRAARDPSQASRSPTPPATIRANEAILTGLADSPSSRMPTATVPAAPMPV